MDTLIQYVQRILAWLLQFVDWCLAEIFSVVLTALLAILNAIPVPAWVSNAGSSIASLPPGILYFSQALDFSFGISVALSAYGIRFLIRRLPVVG